MNSKSNPSGVEVLKKAAQMFNCEEDPDWIILDSNDESECSQRSVAVISDSTNSPRSVKQECVVRDNQIAQKQKTTSIADVLSKFEHTLIQSYFMIQYVKSSYCLCETVVVVPVKEKADIDLEGKSFLSWHFL